MSDVEQRDEALRELVERLVRKWQPRLGLRDWTIGVEIFTGEPKGWNSAKGDDEPGACSHVVARAKRLRVCIPTNHDEKYGTPSDPDDEAPEDRIEHSVIHELLHAVGEPWETMLNDEIKWLVGGKGDSIVGADLRSAWSEYRENTINDTATMLLAADRGKWADQE